MPCTNFPVHKRTGGVIFHFIIFSMFSMNVKFVNSTETKTLRRKANDMPENNSIVHDGHFDILSFFDLNGDSFVDEKEFHNGVRKLLSKKKVEKWYKDYVDTNKDGKESDAEKKAAFNKFDTGKDGKLDKDELTEAMKKIGVPWGFRGKVADEIIKQCDSPPCDGKLTLDELNKALAGGNPDPHFTTWHGQKYDYHGECDLVYTKCSNFNHGKGLQLHLRTRHVKPKNWSTISGIALQIDNDVFELTEVGDFYINSKKNPALPMMLGGHNLSKARHVKTLGNGELKVHDAYKISLVDGSSLKVGFTSWGKAKEFLYFKFNSYHDVDDFSDCVGLSSSYSDNSHKGQGILIGRNGTHYKRNLIDTVNFAEEWQVRPDADGKLFKKAEGPQFPEECVRSPFDVRDGRRHLEALYAENGGENHVRAMEACKHHMNEGERENCVFDVLVTGDENMAHSPWHE